MVQIHENFWSVVFPVTKATLNPDSNAKTGFYLKKNIDGDIKGTVA